MKEVNHKIYCKNPHCIGGRIETSFAGDDGYSEWTVLDPGYIEFKCHGCGKFASTNSRVKPNEPNNFEVICLKCGSTEWIGNIQDIECDEEKTNIECTKCHAKTFGNSSVYEV